jgi:amidase
MEAALSDLSRLGAKLIDPANVPHADELGDPEFTVLLFDFKHDLNKYLSELRRSQVRTLAQTITFNKAHAAEEMPFFGQDIFELAQQSGPLSDPTYKEALATCHRLARREGINAVMRRHDLDAIVAPTASPSWTTDLINGDHFLLGSSSPAAVAGFPNITVPAGFSFGLPVGISFFGRAWSEPKLIRLASGFEHGTRVRKPPRFKATVGTRDFEPRGIARTVSRREAPARTSASPRKPATL